MIPILKEGFDPPQGLSYKKLSDRLCLFARSHNLVVRLEASKKFPWITVKAQVFPVIG